MIKNRDVCVIIPCLNPDEKFLHTVSDLLAAGFSYILVVNDGSDKDSMPCFEVAADIGCTVLRHHINLGKGRAHKTAFNHYLNDTRGCLGVVTVDADGQHKVEDIAACVQKMGENPAAMVLGCRNFDNENVPKKSRVGNRVMCAVFKMFCGIQISDTQTGLHAMANEILLLLMEIPGERFEYETNLLLDLKKKNIAFEEVEIETVYIEENKSSHFRPFKDTVRIAGIVVKFLLSSLSTAALDFVLFAAFAFLLSFMDPIYTILLATVLARVISSACNYLINKSLVFSTKTQGKTAVKYYILALFIMALSYGGVMALSYLGINSVVAKIPVDLVLFLISFTVQREWVFR